MSVSTFAKIPFVRNRTINALLLGAIALTVSGFASAHGADASPQPASTVYPTAIQPTIVAAPTLREAGNRSDWNVDYPSQLAPQAVRVANSIPASSVTSTVDQDANEQF